MTKKIYFIMVLVIGAIICVLSCTRNNVEAVQGPNPCDTTQVSYQKILNPSCRIIAIAVTAIATRFSAME